jgi:hypothetical protein
MASKHIPIPLFDSLEHCQLEKQIPYLKPHLPAALNEEHSIADYQHACSFLHAYRGSAETFKSYRREIERLLQWSWFIAAKSLKELRRVDLENFLEFCQAPPTEWIGIKHVPRFLDKNGEHLVNPEWRPFIASISKRDY